MARVERLNHEDKTVRIFADIRVAGRIQVAKFFKKSVDFHTQFEQNLPLAPCSSLATSTRWSRSQLTALI